MADASLLKRLRNRFLGTKKRNIAARAPSPKQSRIVGRGSRKAAAPAAVAAPAVASAAPVAITGYEDMDKVNKEEAAKKEIDTVDKALAFAKGYREYIQSLHNKLTNEQIEEKQKVTAHLVRFNDEEITKLRQHIKHLQGFRKLPEAKDVDINAKI